MAKLPEPVNGRNNKNSVSSAGIPKAEKKGLTKLESLADKPLMVNSSMAKNMATKYGKIPTHKEIAPLAPFTKWS